MKVRLSRTFIFVLFRPTPAKEWYNLVEELGIKCCHLLLTHYILNVILNTEEAANGGG